MQRITISLLVLIFALTACTISETPTVIPTQESPTASVTASPPTATATLEPTPTITPTAQFYALVVNLSSTEESCPNLGNPTFSICVPGLFVTLTGRKLDNYKVTVNGPGFSEVTFECPQVTTLLRFGENMAPVDCTSDTIRFITVGVTEITFNIEWDGGSINQTYHPTYETFAPNGEQCDPQCPNATIEINIP